jgi:hypothetical protein
MSESEADVRRDRWIYTGQILDTKGRPFHKWLRLEGDQALEDMPPIDERIDAHVPIYYRKRRNLVPGRPGMVYQFDVQYQDGHPTGILGEGREYLGTWPHVDQVTFWQLRHDAERTRARAEQLAKKERRRNHWHERLDPVRELYQNTRTVDRPALLSMIVEYITRP